MTIIATAMTTRIIIRGLSRRNRRRGIRTSIIIITITMMIDKKEGLIGEMPEETFF